MPSGHVESFRSHANYVRAFALLCSAPYSPGKPRLVSPLDLTLDRLAPAVAAAPSMVPPGGATVDLAQAEASLANAWGTELLLAFGGEVATDEEFVRVMNNWAAVQTYYAGYHAAQALIVARGQPRPESHPKTQKQFAALWADRDLWLPPWTFAACDGGWRNPPSRPIEDGVSPWKGCDPHSCWDLAGKAMRTTREPKIAERHSAERARKRTAKRKKWEAEEATRIAKGRKPRKEPKIALPRLTDGEKARYAQRVRSYTVLDYLYRLRVKANYEDAGMFIHGPEDNDSSSWVNHNLVVIASCTLLVHELHVGAAVGKATFMGWVDGWLARNAAGRSIGLGLRRDLLDTHLS